MGSAYSSWKMERKLSKRPRADSDLLPKKTSAGNVTRLPKKAKTLHNRKQRNILEEMAGRPVRRNPLYRQEEMLDNGILFDEIVAKIEKQAAAKLSSSLQRYEDSPKGFDSFMMY